MKKENDEIITGEEQILFLVCIENKQLSVIWDSNLLDDINIVSENSRKKKLIKSKREAPSMAGASPSLK